MKNLILTCLLIFTGIVAFGRNKDLIIDAITGDTLVFSGLTRYESAMWPQLNPHEEVGLIYFTFADPGLEKLRHEMLWPRMLTRWKSEAFQQDIKSAATDYKPLYKRYYELFGQMDFYSRHEADLKVKVEEIRLKPVSLANGILTIAEVSDYNFSLNQDEETQYSSLFYLDIKKKKLFTADDLLAKTDTAALKQKLLEKWEGLVYKVPESYLNLEPQSDIAMMIGEPEMEGTVSLDSLVVHGLAHVKWNKALITWTGSGVMVSFKSGFFTDSRLLNMPFQLHLETSELKGVFARDSPYKFVNDFKDTEQVITNFDPFELSPSHWISFLKYHHWDWSRVDSGIGSIKILVQEFPEEDPKETFQYIYKEGKIYQAELLGSRLRYRKHFVQWRNDEIYQVSSLEANRQDMKMVDGKPQGKVRRNTLNRFKDDSGNVQYSLEAGNNGRLSLLEYFYFPERVDEVKYTVLGNVLLPNTSFVLRYFLEPNGWCQSNGLCVRYNEKGQVVARGSRQFLYDDKGRVKQEMSSGGDSYVLYYYNENDLLSGLEFYRGTEKGSAYKYHYSEGAMVPDEIESYKSNPGRWIKYIVKKEHVPQE